MVRRGKQSIPGNNFYPFRYTVGQILSFCKAGTIFASITSPRQIAWEIVELAEAIAEESGAKVNIGSLFRRERPRMLYELYEEIRADVNFWCLFLFPMLLLQYVFGPKDVWVDCAISSDMVFISPKIKSSSTGPFHIR